MKFVMYLQMYLAGLTLRSDATVTGYHTPVNPQEATLSFFQPSSVDIGAAIIHHTAETDNIKQTPGVIYYEIVQP